MKNFYKKGITLVEVLAVLTVLGGIFLVVLPQFSKIKENQVLKNGVADILSSIDKARGETISSLNSSEYGVHFQSDKVIIFKGTTYSPGAADNEAINIISPATISTISLTAGAVDVYFARLSGAPNKTGTITITTSNYSKIVTISATGVASAN